MYTCRQGQINEREALQNKVATSRLPKAGATQGYQAPLRKNFATPLEKVRWLLFKSIGHSFKNFGHSQHTLRPPWCPKVIKRLRTRLFHRSRHRAPDAICTGSRSLDSRAGFVSLECVSTCCSNPARAFVAGFSRLSALALT